MMVPDKMIAASRHTLLKRLSRDARLVNGEGGLERRPLIEHFDRITQLTAAVGYGPRVLAACYLHCERLDAEQILEQTSLDADIANLVFWARDENSHLPASIRESIYHSKLRSAPSAALAIVCARQISNLESIVRMQKEDVERGLLCRCGFEPLSRPLGERHAALVRLKVIFDRGVPLTLRRLFHSCVDDLEKLLLIDPDIATALPAPSALLAQAEQLPR